jgi:hypothetical protein
MEMYFWVVFFSLNCVVVSLVYLIAMKIHESGNFLYTLALAAAIIFGSAAILTIVLDQIAWLPKTF